jgi:hypothetical protein
MKATGGVTPVAEFTKRARSRYFCDRIAAFPKLHGVANRKISQQNQGVLLPPDGWKT